MTLKKTLSILVALMLVSFSAIIALAEDTDTTTTTETTEATDATETTEETAEEATEETADEETEETYTLEEMLTAVMADAYERQAAYAVYAEAYSESQSITSISVDTQIVLLEMLLKSYDIDLPDDDIDVTAPETKAEAYRAIADAEANAETMLETYLAEESLPEDAQIIFNTVLKTVTSNASTFEQKAQSAEKQQEWTDILEDDNTKIIVVNNNTVGPNGSGSNRGGGRTSQTVYIYTTGDSEDETEATDDDTTETVTDDAAEETTSD